MCDHEKNWKINTKLCTEFKTVNFETKQALEDVIKTNYINGKISSALTKQGIIVAQDFD